MESEDKKTIFTKRNILLLIILIIVILLFVVGCQLLKRKESSIPNIPNIPNIIEATSIRVDVSSIELKVGETKKINAIIIPSNAVSNVLLFSSNDSEIAVVDGSGNVTGLKKGETVITIRTSNGIEEKVEVKVLPNENDNFKDKPTILFGKPVGTKGTGKWYISNVKIAVNVKDAITIKYCLSSGIKCTPKTLMKSGAQLTLKEGVWRIYVSATNKAGTTENSTELIYIDITKPTISFVSEATVDGAKITFTCKDGTSAVSSCAGKETTTTTLEKVKQSGTYVVKDKAGNQASIDVNVKSEKQWRKAKCTPSWSDWVRQPEECLYGDTTLYKSHEAITKAYAEGHGYGYYYSCGASEACYHETGHIEGCFKYTRTCGRTKCGTFGTWQTSDLGSSNCSQKVETRTIYKAN